MAMIMQCIFNKSHIVVAVAAISIAVIVVAVAVVVSKCSSTGGGVVVVGSSKGGVCHVCKRFTRSDVIECDGWYYKGVRTCR